MSLRDFASGLIGNRDGDVKDDGDAPVYVERTCSRCDCRIDPNGVCGCDATGCYTCERCGRDVAEGSACICREPSTEADAETSIDYQHPDALPAVDAAEDAGLSAVRKLEKEES